MTRVECDLYEIEYRLRGTITEPISCFPSPTDPDLRADLTIFFTFLISGPNSSHKSLLGSRSKL